MRRDITTLPTISILITILLACESNTNDLGKSALVLQGYLYENEVVSGIKLTKSIPFGSGNSLIKITDASVYIYFGDREYLLQVDTDSTYYNTDSTLQIIAEQDYSIKIEYEDVIISAKTHVPLKPEGLKISDTVLYVEEDFTPTPGMMGGQDTADLTISWENPDNDYFYVLVNNLEENPESIELGFSPPEGMSNFSFLSQPFVSDSYSISVFRSIQQYGRHRVKIFRVNDEYAYLYENREQDSRYLTEPYSNVLNGLGIFTAFSYSEVYFEVVKE